MKKKKFQIFINSPHTLNLVIKLKFSKKSEIFEKKSEIFGFEKIYKNYLIFFLLYKIEEDDRKK